MCHDCKSANLHFAPERCKMWEVPFHTSAPNCLSSNLPASSSSPVQSWFVSVSSCKKNICMGQFRWYNFVTNNFCSSLYLRHAKTVYNSHHLTLSFAAICCRVLKLHVSKSNKWFATLQILTTENIQWLRWDLNPQPSGYMSTALPSELQSVPWRSLNQLNIAWKHELAIALLPGV